MNAPIMPVQVRVNWAAQREQKVDTTSHFHIFVGDLAPEINDRALLEAFSVIPTCSDARVVWDHTTGRCALASALVVVPCIGQAWDSAAHASCVHVPPSPSCTLMLLL